MYVEIIFHGRGGQGAVTAANVLAGAAVREGKWSQAFPHFGAERRGAPVRAYARISDEPISRHSQIYAADIAVVLDDKLFELVDIVSTVKKDGVIIVNTAEQKIDLDKGKRNLYCVDAVSIAKELGLIVAGWPVVNTAMLGAFSALTGIVSLESIVEEIKANWPGKTGEANAEAARRAYKLVSKCGV